MKYAFLCSVASMVLYYDDMLVAAGLLGYVAAAIYIFHYLNSPLLMTIPCLAAAVLTVMYFPFEISLDWYMRLGVVWAWTIAAFFVILVISGAIQKMFKK